jgi:hypothetical protein
MTAPIISYDNTIINGSLGEPQVDIYTADESQAYEVGTKLEYGDGRVFRYSRAGGVIGAALMSQQAVVETKLVAVAQTAHPQVVGATEITVLITTGATLVDDELAGGFFNVNKGAASALGDIYKIKSSKLQATDTLLDLVLETPIRNAIVATDEITIVPAKQSNVVVFPTTQTGAANGAALIDVADNEYFWAQTAGPAPVIVDTSETVAIGDTVGAPAAMAVAGACGVRVTLKPSWGTVMIVAAAAEPAIVDLDLE